MIDKIYRENSTVCINIDTNLGTCRPVYQFRWKCGDDQELAELLARHLNKRLEEFKKEIARDAIYYLNASETTALKKRLRDWDSKKEEWK